MLSGFVALNVSVPALSFITVTTMPEHPAAVESGRVIVAEPGWMRDVCARSMIVVDESHWNVYGVVVTGDVLLSVSEGEDTIGGPLA